MSEASLRAERLAQLPFEDVGGNKVGFIGGLPSSIREIYARRELLRLLVRRELKARYKDSRLGLAWSLIRPITMLAIYWIAIGQFLGAARGVPDFAIFVFTGLTLWGLYSEIVSSGTNSILSNAGLVKKVYLPREIFPLAAAGSALVNFVIQFAVLLVGVMVLSHLTIGWTLLYLPLGILLAVVYGLALALFFSAINVYLRDIQYLVEVAILIFFWASPIVYPWSYVVNASRDLALPWIQDVYLANPITIAILCFQRALWSAGSETTVLDGTTIAAQPWPDALPWIASGALVIGLVLVWFAQRLFSRLQGNFAQEL